MASLARNNKQIARNTVVLYIRMIIVLLIGLYSSRVILNALGVVDYGIYNAVGGLVVMFSYIDSALSQATTRFYSYELPHSVERVNSIFNTSIVIQIVFAIIIIVIAETLGLWLVNNKMIIPIERLGAANWVYQFSIVTTIITILSVPFNAAITSHEKMSLYAVLSMSDAILKLIVAVMIAKSPIDELVFYGLGLMIISLFIFVTKIYFCLSNFKEVRFNNNFSQQLLKKMFSFVGWNFFGATAGISVSQGLNFIINIFFGPAINAARGIAFQVQGAINQFVTNINVAVNPQIIKRYSVGEIESMFRLVFFSSKISFLLLSIVSIPIIIDTTYVLELWLKVVPEHAVLFTRLMLIYMLTVAVTYSVNISAQASGNIKMVQIAEGIIILMNIPCVLLLFYLGLPAYTSFLSMILFSILALIAKLSILHKTIGFPVKKFLTQVISRLLFVSIFCVIIFSIASRINIESFEYFVIKTICYLIPLSLIVWFVGLVQNERHFIVNFIRGYLNKK